MEKANAIVEMVGGSEYNDSIIEPKYLNVNKYSVFPKVTEGNKGMSKEQKQCFLCRNNIGGLVEKKKFTCSFCYNAVCQNCSPLKCNHPETLKEERVCMQCYIFAIEDQVRNEVKGQINTEFGADEQDKRIKETLKSEITDYEQELKTLDVNLQNAHEELERLKVLKAKKIEDKNRKINEERIKNDQEIENYKEKIIKTKEECKRKRELIVQQENEIEALKKHLVLQEEKVNKFREEAEAEKKKEIVFRKSIKVEENFPEKEQLLKELNDLKSHIAQLQREQEELEKQRKLVNGK